MNEVGIPELKWNGTQEDYHILVIERLGPSLQDLLMYCDYRISVKTVLMLAFPLIDHMEYIHSKSYIHRDVKLENFVMGNEHGPHKGVVYMIDFGMAHMYKEESGAHIPCEEVSSPHVCCHCRALQFFFSIY
jgi:serine/threonine protein kinase